MSTIDPRSMALAGVVKVDARRAGGSVKTLAVKGEHRVLVPAAAKAVRRSKWESWPQESHELVEVHFNAPQ
jgi:hypothetical protein